MGRATHGHTRGRTMPRTYVIWKTMHKRCTNPNARGYARYGGRGIQVCQEWRDYAVFLNDMGEAPTGRTLDRINNDGPYTKANCRWATHKEQSHNSSRPRFIEHNGQRLCIRDWEKRLDLSCGALWHRIKNGWPVERALTERKQS